MQIKSKLLIAGAIISLIALTTMQGYLIFNTFDLQKNRFAVESRTKIGAIVSQPHVDSLSWDFRNAFVGKISDYKNGLISKKDLLGELTRVAKQKNVEFKHYFTEGANRMDLNENVLYKKFASSIVLFDSKGQPEILLDETVDGPLFLLGEDFPMEDGMRINGWNWTFDQPVTYQDGETEQMIVKFSSSIHMKIIDWDKIIFKQLLFLFFIAFLLFLFIITLVTYSIRNLFKLKRISEIKTDFINNITHELKTPLATLSIATKTLTNRFAKDNTDIASGSIDTINRQNKRLQDLIDQVIDTSLGYSGIKLNLEQTNLPEFLNNVCDDYALTTKNHVQFLREVAPNDDMVLIDKFYLSTAIINILNNAIKFDGTIIKLKYELIHNMHVISISDNGIGISKKNKSLIFGKFYRVTEKHTHNYKGLGLGLYYCSQIIKAHHGTIEVESKPKQGSTFYLKIPMGNGRETDIISG